MRERERERETEIEGDRENNSAERCIPDILKAKM